MHVSIPAQPPVPCVKIIRRLANGVVTVDAASALYLTAVQTAPFVGAARSGARSAHRRSLSKAPLPARPRHAHNNTHTKRLLFLPSRALLATFAKQPKMLAASAVAEVLLRNGRDILNCIAPDSVFCPSPLALVLAIAAPHFLYALVWLNPGVWQAVFGKRSVDAFATAGVLGKGAFRSVGGWGRLRGSSPIGTSSLTRARSPFDHQKTNSHPVHRRPCVVRVQPLRRRRRAVRPRLVRAPNLARRLAARPPLRRLRPGPQRRDLPRHRARRRLLRRALGAPHPLGDRVAL